MRPRSAYFGETEEARKITESVNTAGFSLQMVLYVSAKTAKSSDITEASADTTHGQ